MRNWTCLALSSLSLVLAGCGTGITTGDNPYGDLGQAIDSDSTSIGLTPVRTVWIFDSLLRKIPSELNPFMPSVYADVPQRFAVKPLSFDPVFEQTYGPGGDCSNLDATDKVAILPLTDPLGGGIGFVPEIPQGTKFLIYAFGQLDGTTPSKSQTVVNNGVTGHIDATKPKNGDGSSGCYYYNFAITNGWTFSLSGCTTAAISQDGQPDGQAILTITGNGETCTVTASGKDRLGSINQTAQFKTVAASQLPAITPDQLTMDGHPVNIDQPITLDLDNPANPVTAFGSPALRVQLNHPSFQANGTFWGSTSNTASNQLNYDWVINKTQSTTFLLNARIASGNVLAQYKFIVVPKDILSGKSQDKSH